MAKLLEQITREGLIGFVDAPAAGLSDAKLVAADQIIEGTQINLDDMRSLRKTILGLREEFRILVDKLKA